MARGVALTQLRWSDLDAFDHVNNVQIVRLLEEARVRVFWPATPAEGTAASTTFDPKSTVVVARQEIQYSQPIPYFSDPLVIEIWVGRFGGASVDIYYEVKAPESAPPASYAIAMTTIVFLDKETLRPRKLYDDEREFWGRFVDDPLEFRRS